MRINNDEQDPKRNYKYNNKNNYYSRPGNRDIDEFGPKKFYGKIRTNNNDRENRPKKIEKEKDKEERENEEDNFQKPKFINSHLDITEGNENLKELEIKGDLFYEKFKKYGDSSKGIEKVENRNEKEEEEGGENEEENRYYKKDSNKRKHYKKNYNNYYNNEDYYFKKVLGENEEKEYKEENEEEKEEEKKEGKREKKGESRQSKKIIKKHKEKEKDKDKEKKEEEKIEGVIKEGNKTIVKGSGAKNLKDLFSKK